MSMTREEKVAKNYLRRVLSTNGYPTYAKIFEKFDFNFTKDPGVVAYLDPEKGIIVANRGLDENQICVIIRHEILHDYLRHEKRLLNKLAAEKGLDPDDLDDLSIKDLKKDLYSNKNFNIAGDYEISNRGYTDRDKETVRNISLNGRILSGLVTEDDHPEWANMSIEEMFDELRKEQENIKPEENIVMGVMAPLPKGITEPIFIGVDGVIYSDPSTLEKLKAVENGA